MLTLYHFPSSVCAAKVRLVLHEKELPWESRIIEILKGEQFQPWYVALNPNAVVPTLVHDDQPIVESAVICEYLDDVFPEPLLPMMTMISPALTVRLMSRSTTRSP